MRRIALFALISAFAGGYAAVWVGQHFQFGDATAVEQRPPAQTQMADQQVNQRGNQFASNTYAPDSYAPGQGSQNGQPVFRPPVRQQPAGSEVTPANIASFSKEEQTNIAVYDKVNRSVVNITTRSVRPDLFLMSETPTEGAGSGSVLDQAGHILTNYHVIEGARQIQVTLFNGQSFDAQLVGDDPPNDIAVLRIDAPAELLEPVEIGDSRVLRVGQKIYAIGNPFGLERTMTVGIISSLNRTLPSKTGRTMKSIIQLDAALNQGNSGGPLLNSHGQLVGMNTAIASKTGQNTGVGFAIPVATINRVVPQLLRNGKVIRADIGIARVYETDKGLLLAALTPNGPADEAGLRGFRMVRRERRQGPYIYEERSIDRDYADLLTSIDGRNVNTVEQMLEVLDAYKPGDRVVASVVRDGETTQVPVVLGED